MASFPQGLLSLPPPGDRTLEKVVRKVRIIALKRLLAHPIGDLSPPLAASLPPLRAALTGAARDRKRAEVILQAIGAPDVLPRLLVLEAGLGNAEDLLCQAVPALLAELVRLRDAGVLEEHILWDVPLSAVADGRGLRSFSFDPPAQSLLADASGLAVALGGSGKKISIPDAPEILEEEEGLRCESPFFPITDALPGLYFATVDSNPLSMIEAHPDKEGNAIDLGGHPVEEWVQSLGDALGLVETYLPDWFGELQVGLERIVPVGYLPEAHLSASYREAPGTVYMTLHPNVVTLAEALIHETQHGKANALSWVDPILFNAHTTWTESAVRPDLRPLWGVLLAVHAFVPVAALHHAMAEAKHPLAQGEWFERRRAQVLQGNANGIATLREKSQASAIGKRVLDALYTLDVFLQESAPPPPEGIDLEAMPPG